LFFARRLLSVVTYENLNYNNLRFYVFYGFYILSYFLFDFYGFSTLIEASNDD